MALSRAVIILWFLYPKVTECHFVSVSQKQDLLAGCHPQTNSADHCRVNNKVKADVFYLFLKPSPILHPSTTLHVRDVRTRLSQWLGSVHPECLNITTEQRV